MDKNRKRSLADVVASNNGPPMKKVTLESMNHMLNKFLNNFSTLAMEMTKIITDKTKSKDDMNSLVNLFHQSITAATSEITGKLMDQVEDIVPKQIEPKKIYQEFIKAQEEEKSLIVTGIEENKTYSEIINQIQPIIQACHHESKIEKVTRLGKSKLIKVTLTTPEQRQNLLQKLHLAKNQIQSNNIKIRKFLNQDDLQKVKERNQLIAKIRNNDPSQELCLYKMMICRKVSNGLPQILTKEEINKLVNQCQ